MAATALAIVRLVKPALAAKLAGIASLLEIKRYQSRSAIKVAQSSRATRKSARESPVKTAVVPNRDTGLLSLRFWLIVTAPELRSTW